MTITVIKAIAHTDLFGDLAQTFYSMEELNRYANNKYVKSVTIISEEVIQQGKERKKKNDQSR